MGMWYDQYQTEYIDPAHDEIEPIIEFLNNFGMHYEKDIEKTIVIKKEDEIIATGSYSYNVIKAIAIDRDYHGQGLLNTIVTLLRKMINQQNSQKVFVYTQKKEAAKFKSLGFSEISSLGSYPVLLEDAIDGVEQFSNNLKNRVMDKFEKNWGSAELGAYQTAALVVNCNPITRGHLYLIKKAARENDIVLVFVVSEDRSLFPTQVRYGLVKEATRNYDNIIIFKGGEYILSHATFPSYFIGPDSESKLNRIYAELDVKVFGEYIGQPLNIDRRYVGYEPFSPVTAAYNQALEKYLPQYNIELRKIERKEYKGEPISASRVRKYIKEKKLKKISPLVPDVTFEFLQRTEAKKIISKIRNTDSRH